MPFLVLTDGKEWNFYLPLEQGNYLDRKLFKLDLLDRNLQKTIDRFEKYLAFDRVINGSALEDSKNDYLEISRRREAEIYIPQAWQKLVEDRDDALINLLIDSVQSLSGFRPDRESCEQYLLNILTSLPVRSVTQQPRDFPTHRKVNNTQIGYKINGQSHSENSARNVMIAIFKYLASIDPTFLDRFSTNFGNSNRRKIISRRKEELYPNRPEFYNDKGMSREFLPGWWIGLNYSKDSIKDRILEALSFAGKRKGEEIDFYLGE